MNDFILIANPISGKGHAKNVAEQAHAALTDAGQQGQLVFTAAAGDAKRFAHEAAANGVRFIIACGGDGTLHEVVNGIATFPDVILGVLPCGRGNDFAAAIGVPLKSETAIATLLSGTPIHVDLGRCYHREPRTANREPRTADHYFTTIATCGYDAEVSRRAAKGTPVFAGTASYAYAAVETLFYYDPPVVHLEGDFGTYDGEILLAATGITNRYGGGFKIVPDARIDDGLFDVCIIRPVSELTVLRLMVTLFWGGHVSHPAVSIHRTRAITIKTETPLLLYADGEPMSETPVTIETIKHGLVVMSPR